MYRSWNLHRFLRYVVFDLVLILAAVLLTHIGKQHFMAVESQGVPLPVLMYHSVTEVSETKFCVTPQTFEEDLQYLKKNGYQTVSAEELIQYTNGTGALPSHPIMLTFDDGLYNNLSLVLPLLEKYDMCAVVSVVGSFTDVYAPDAPHNDVYSYLTWDDLRQLKDSGRIDLGSHTYDLHSNQSRGGSSKLDWETEEEYHTMLSADLALLQTRFQEELEMRPVVFAYPYGFLSPESKSVLRENGFFISLTCLEQTNFITQDPECLYGINRFNRNGNCSTEDFMERVL